MQEEGDTYRRIASTSHTVSTLLFVSWCVLFLQQFNVCNVVWRYCVQLKDDLRVALEQGADDAETDGANCVTIDQLCPPSITVGDLSRLELMRELKARQMEVYAWRRDRGLYY